MTIRMLLAAVSTIACSAPEWRTRKPPRKSPPQPSTKKVQAPRTAKSLECSKEADGKSLHGKARKKFMRTCKKA